MQPGNFPDRTEEPGIALRHRMTRWLVRTGWLELSNVLLFSLALWIASLFDQRILGFFSVMCLIAFNAVAIQGGLYWLARHAGMFKAVRARTCLRVLYGSYVFNISLLLFIPGTLVVAFVNGRAPGPGELWIGSVFYLFGLGKFLHYYLFKINRYSLVDPSMAPPYTPSPARFRREFQRARRLTSAMPVRNESRSMI